MQVRQYRKGDEKSIAEIYNRAFQKQIASLPNIYQYRRTTPEEAYNWRSGGANSFWIIESDGEPIGFAQIRIEVERGEQEIPVLQFMPARCWDMNECNLAVLPEYQRRGVATQLIHEIIKSHEPDAMIVTAHTFSDNLAGESLFASCKFDLHDAFYYSPFSKTRPLANSSVYESLDLEHLQEPKFDMPKAHFRRAELKDAEAVRQLHEYNVFWCEECLTIGWNREYIEGRYGHIVFVLEHDGRVVGAMDYYKDGRIGIAGVLPEYRGKGFGSTLFHDFLREMMKAGFKTAFVDSGLTQTDAIKMYERFNFTIQRRQNCWVKVLR